MNQLIVLALLLTALAMPVVLFFLTRSRLRSFVLYPAIWVSAALLFGAMGSFETLRLWTLAAEGVRTQGVVIAYEKDNHDLVRYAYRVGTVTYPARGPAARASSLQPGEPVLVYYAPTFPTTSILGDPKEQLRNALAGTVVLIVLFPTLVVATVAFARRRGKVKGPEPGHSPESKPLRISV